MIYTQSCQFMIKIIDDPIEMFDMCQMLLLSSSDHIQLLIANQPTHHHFDNLDILILKQFFCCVTGLGEGHCYNLFY